MFSFSGLRPGTASESPEPGPLANDKVQVYDEDVKVGRRTHLENWVFQMATLGSTAKFVRESLGMTQRAAAESLGVWAVHLSNVERDVTLPSSSLIARFTEVFGVDVYVLHYCTDDDTEDAAEGVNQARRKLAEALRRQLGNTVKAGG